MNKEQSIKIGMSLALATVLSLGVTGCGGSSDDDAAASVSSAVDVVVERGKVYDANVTDSSTPAQVATQKSRQNVYTFANTPVYPVVANGGWIDVNDDGVMDVNDTKLDIEMKSYSTSVTPVTTLIADANATLREQNLENLITKLNESGVGSDANVTAEDLLKVPSAAPRDVMIVSNAIFKDMKEQATVAPSLDDVMTQFGTIDGALSDGATAVEAEQAVIADLDSQSLVTKVAGSEILKFDKDVLGNALPPLAVALLKNNITFTAGWAYKFYDNYTVELIHVGLTSFVYGWNVDDKTLTIEWPGDREEYVFPSTTPQDGDTVVKNAYYGDTTVTSNYTAVVTAPVVVTPPTTGGDTTLDLSAYSSIIIYKNISQTIADSLLSAYASNSGFKSENTSASCTDFGFTNPTVAANVKVYSVIDGANSRSCSEADYANEAYTSGTANILAYYGN